MFKFSFGDAEVRRNEAETGLSYLAQDRDMAKAWLVARPELKLVDSSSQSCDIVEMVNGDVQFRKCTTSTPPASLAPESSDLVPGSYEGGYKLWECTGDLVSYLHRTSLSSLSGMSVLELGAGHALPALFAVRSGAAIVDVADFNEQVLLDVTHVNIRLNCEGPVADSMRMVAGDWAGIPQVLDGAQYDYVLAAEVVYSLDSVNRLADCVLRTLKPGGGIALIAGKTYYFGVGGGMRAFQTAIEQQAAALNVNVSVHVAEELRDGISNVREILRIEKL
jgi:SAM-dependent methyltransferase